MAIKYLRTSNIKNKTVLVRASVDEPVDEKTGKVADDFRIQSALASVELLLKNNNKVIVCGKLGRPEGIRQKACSLKPAAERMADLLKLKFVETNYKLPTGGDRHLIFYTGNIEEQKHRDQIGKSAVSDVLFLENLEFYKTELSNNALFGKHLASLADAYVNDDFAKCHHVVASIGAITKYLPSYAGLVLEREIQLLGQVLERPKSPFVVMMGGIKISDKAKTLQTLGKKADTILLAGGLANLFFLSRGYEIGLSKAETESRDLAWHMDKNFKGKLVLPTDVVVANKDLDKKSIRVCSTHEVGRNELILDVGPKTILQFSNILKKANTIVWNGPLGHFECKPFHTGTMALARVVGGRSRGRAFAVVGGGETVDAVRLAGQAEHIDHLSTGGGAMLEFLAGNKLSGIEALA